MAIRHICNMCGKDFDQWDEQENFNIYTLVGYGSKHDNEHLELDLCCDCMDEIIDRCKISPIAEERYEHPIIRIGDSDDAS